MNKTLYIIALITISTSSFAQYKLGAGDKQLNAGFGLSSWGAPLYVGVDFGVKENVSVGAEFSFRSTGDINNDNRRNTFTFSGNGNYHFVQLLEIPDEWDVYAGLSLGYYNSSYSNTSKTASGINLGAQVGGRYYFKDNFAFNIEFGGGSSFSSGKFGISFIF
jgi:hypothetical protein